MTAAPPPAWLRWVRLAARVRLDAIRAEWAQPRSLRDAVDAIVADGAPLGPAGGGAVGAAGHGAPGDGATAGVAGHGAWRDDAALAAAREAALGDPRWRTVVRGLRLTDAEAELLALLAAAHLDPGWHRVLGYLADDPRPLEVTPAAAGLLWGRCGHTMPGPGGPLARWQLAAPLGPDPWLATTPWGADPDVVAYLCGAPDWAAFWPGLERPEPPESEPVHAAVLAELEHAARGVAGAPLELEVVGAPGSGRRTLLRRLCAALDRDALVIGPAAPPVRALRTARLLSAVPVWVDADVVADDRPGALTLAARTAAATAPAPGVRLTWTLRPLDRPERRTVWDAARAGAPAPAVEHWSMTPAEVVAAAAAAPAGPATAAAAARRRLGAVSSALLTPVRLPFDWDDLVVAPGVRDQLRELEEQIRHAPAVLDDWGFSRLTPAGRGLTALFAGPSGTGKTMAAQVLARSLGLDLVAVNLAEVVDKYIGETEKRLAHVFDACERGNVMVLFDEADALFGQRTQVRDAHDRFANIEIDFLLQRMETFDGVAVLATNRRGDLDQAFVRRIRVIVDFLRPGRDERLRLWELAVPAHGPGGTPIANGIDRAWLAGELQLTGAEIKAVALAAAFRAHGAGELIGTEHVVAAARRELAKRGSILRTAGVAGGAA